LEPAERAEQPESEIYRVIVFRQAGMELLLTSTENGVSLPEVTTPRWQRAAENLGLATKSTWGEEVICLFQSDATTLGSSDNRIHYQVAEHWGSAGKSEVPTQWVSLDDLRQDSFVDHSDYAAIEQSVAERDTWARDPVGGPFAQLGWFKELYEWIEGEIAPRGLHLNGNFRQLNASPSFSLIRFEADGPAVWFKAVGEPNQREFPITLALARLFPEHVPPILAVRPAWNGWLMIEAEGTNLGESKDVSVWERAVAEMAELQVASVSTHRQLLRSGAHDLRTRSLRDVVSPFMSLTGHLMGRQLKVPPPVLSEMELKLLGERIQEALSQAEELGIPDTLGHLDANPGNIIISRSGCAFLDWAEAYVGHPFFSFQYLVEHFRRIGGADSSSESRLAAAYLRAWEHIASRECLAEAMTLAPLLAAFAYVAGTDTWRQPERLRDLHSASYLRGLTRRMNREAKQLSDGKAPCLI